MDMKRQRRHAERLRVKLLDVNYFAEKKSPQQLALDRLYESEPRKDRIKRAGGSRGKCEAFRIPYVRVCVLLHFFFFLRVATSKKIPFCV